MPPDGNGPAAVRAGFWRIWHRVAERRREEDRAILDWHRSEIRMALEAGGCLVCVKIRQDLSRFFFWFLTENYAAPEWRGTVRRAHGFCRWHSQRLVEIGSRYVLSVVMEQLLEDVGRDLKQAAAGTVIRKEEDCPACQVEDDTAAQVIRRFLGTFEDEEIVDRYQRGSGLCWPHILRTLRDAPVSYHDRLMEPVHRHMAQLATDLREYFRRVDYRFSQEPKGAEQYAWFMAMRFMTDESLRPTASDLEAVRAGRAQSRGLAG